MKATPQLLAAVTTEVRRTFRRARGSHDWEHTQRVLDLALHIGRRERADLDVIRFAAVLHDIARHDEDRSHGRVDHAVLGAQRARRILQRHGLPDDFIAAVCHCIECHRFRNELRPRTPEARVLFDADKLDSIGAVGIGRAFLFAGEVGAKLHNPDVDVAHTRAYGPEDTAWREYQVKLRFIKSRILTAEGKRLARARHTFMVQFFRRLNGEVAGRL